MIANELIWLIVGSIYIAYKIHQETPGVLLGAAIAVPAYVSALYFPLIGWRWIAYNVNAALGIAGAILHAVAFITATALFCIRPGVFETKRMREKRLRKKKVDSTRAKSAWRRVCEMPEPTEAEIRDYLARTYFGPIHVSGYVRRQAINMIRYERYKKELISERTRGERLCDYILK